MRNRESVNWLGEVETATVMKTTTSERLNSTSEHSNKHLTLFAITPHREHTKDSNTYERVEASGNSDTLNGEELRQTSIK